MVIIYTDGACSGNPGHGGWAYIVIDGDNKYSDFGFVDNTTNQRMELYAAIKALLTLNKICDIKVVSDSQYLVKGMNEWRHNWKRKNWIGSNNKPVKNQDLWKKLDKIASVHASIIFEWVKGHSGHEENDLVDSMARFAIEHEMKQREKQKRKYK